MEDNPSPLVEEEQQPDNKKLKLLPREDAGTAVSSDDEQSNAPITATEPMGKPRYKRRKVAIVFGYCGVGYQGMQKNPGAKTIEGEMEEALYRCGAVPEHDRGKPQRYDWARSARTDKGVSAVGQVVSGRFYVDPPGFVERLNSELPDQIRIFGYKRVTASFNAKKFCDRRRYVYLIPFFAFDPYAHRNRESVLASFGKENELVKCLECSERGRKVIGAVGKRGLDSKPLNGTLSVIEDSSVVLENNSILESRNDNPDLIANGSSAIVKSSDGASSPVASKFEEAAFLSSNDTAAEDILKHKEDNGVNKEADLECPIEENSERKELNKNQFSCREEVRQRFNRILKQYVGSHNFHNFTTRTKAEDPSARRYIISFEAQSVVVVDGVEFLKCEVVGQSFMLHQIRKMIGLAVAIMRDCAPESLLQTALRKDVNINIPTAPEVGLYLDECLFSSYNEKWKDSHEELSMKAYEEDAEEFKMKYIYTHIASMEQKEGAVALWLHSLNHRNYPDLRVAAHEGSCDLTP